MPFRNYFRFKTSFSREIFSPFEPFFFILGKKFQIFVYSANLSLPNQKTSNPFPSIKPKWLNKV